MKQLERVLSSLCILAATIAVAVQIVYFTGYVVPATVFGNDKSISYLDSSIYRKGDCLQIKISDPKAILLINGENALPESTKGDYGVYRVYDKDVVEIDLRSTLKGQEISVFVAVAGENIRFPAEGSKYFVEGGIKTLFKVSLATQRS
ncbi:MAG: hypothetical protein FWG10_09680 [Eubacteriaceae bacterium]|nr:hypothetical protein [Eubacteriaceae bacterium]